jgi:hypothetical protein
MRARHDADSRLRTLSGLYPDGTWRDGLLDSLMREGKVPDANAYLADTGFSAERTAVRAAEQLSRVSRQLMLEGLILQLFGHGLSVCQDESAKHVAPAGGEQQRLERVRRLLEAPENDYTLNELAQRAAMSSSSCAASFARPAVRSSTTCATAAWRGQRLSAGGL